MWKTIPNRWNTAFENARQMPGGMGTLGIDRPFHGELQKKEKKGRIKLPKLIVHRTVSSLLPDRKERCRNVRNFVISWTRRHFVDRVHLQKDRYYLHIIFGGKTWTPSVWVVFNDLVQADEMRSNMKGITLRIIQRNALCQSFVLYFTGVKAQSRNAVACDDNDNIIIFVIVIIVMIIKVMKIQRFSCPHDNIFISMPI